MLLAVIVGTAVSFGGIVSLITALRNYRLHRHILDTPTASPGSISLGLSEVIGCAEPAKGSLRAPLEDTPCLIYHFALFEKHRNDNGTMWKEHLAGTHGVPFFLAGENGRVLVDPTDAEVHLPTPSRKVRFQPSPESSILWTEDDGRPSDVQAFVDRCDDLAEYRVDPLRSHSLHKKVKNFGAGGEKTGEWAFQTERLLPGEDVYVLGHAYPPDRENVPDDVSAVIRAPDDSPGFFSKEYSAVYVISNQSEEDLVENQRSSARWHTFLGIVVLGVGLAILYVPLRFYL